jgi:hypothetical protein
MAPLAGGCWPRPLDEGIGAVDNPPASLVALFDRLDNPPSWVDWEQLRRGSIAYFRAGPLVSFALTCSVIAGSEQADGISRPVVFTGRLEAKAYSAEQAGACRGHFDERAAPAGRHALTGTVSENT